MAQEQQGAKPVPWGTVHGCLTGELAINHYTHLALCEEVRKPLDAILFQLVKELRLDFYSRKSTKAQSSV